MQLISPKPELNLDLIDDPQLNQIEGEKIADDDPYAMRNGLPSVLGEAMRQLSAPGTAGSKSEASFDDRISSAREDHEAIDYYMSGARKLRQPTLKAGVSPRRWQSPPRELSLEQVLTPSSQAADNTARIQGTNNAKPEDALSIEFASPV